MRLDDRVKSWRTARGNADAPETDGLACRPYRKEMKLMVIHDGNEVLLLVQERINERRVRTRLRGCRQQQGIGI